jgi:hypothetical protein
MNPPNRPPDKIVHALDLMGQRPTPERHVATKYNMFRVLEYRVVPAGTEDVFGYKHIEFWYEPEGTIGRWIWETHQCQPDTPAGSRPARHG